MKVFFDTEFTGLHKNTTLISIGLIAENEETFYAEFTDYDRSQCDDWIKENVLPNLYCVKEMNKPVPDNYHIGDKEHIRTLLSHWFIHFGEVELVSDVCHYDMTLLIDIFGGAFNIPDCVCPACHDINQDIAKYYNISMKDAFDKSREVILKENNIVISGDKHNALYDAKVIKSIYEFISKGMISLRLDQLTIADENDVSLQDLFRSYFEDE